MISDLLLGMNAAVFGAIGLFFLRFWTQTRDRLFALFAAAFGIMAVQQVLVALVRPGDESRHWFYVLRLVAFVLIIAAIVDKNRTSSREP